MSVEAEELRVQLEALRRKFDESESLTRIGSWAWDVLSGEVTWSNGLYALLELSPGEADPSLATAIAHVHPDDRERCETALADGQANGNDYYLEHRAVTAKGRVLDVVSRGKVVRDRAGTPIRMLGTVQDVTKLKLANASASQFGTVIEQLDEGVMITDAQSRIEYVNFALERSTGYSREELLGATPGLLKSGKHDEAFYADMWSRLRQGQPWRGLTINKRKDGTLYTEDSTISPVLDAQGRVTKFVAVKRDVTERLELEARLRQGQRMESIGLLAGGIAHDFNNMLSVILGFSEVAMDLLEPEHRVRTHLERIRAAGESSAQLTRQLLAFSRSQALEVDTVDLNRVVQDTDRFLSRVIGSDVELSLRSPPTPIWVEVDRSQLENAVLNLATNAKHAMPNGGALTIETSAVDLAEARDDLPAGRWAVLTASDTGAGMSQETLARVFEPFFTTKPTGKGTGLGLASVHGFVSQSGGRIHARSEEGAGTTFTIYLPTVAPPSGSDVSELGQLASGGAETILLVEDHDLVRELNQEVLQSSGYTVLTASNGVKALQTFRANRARIDLLLTNVVLPGLNGSELVERALQEAPELKVAFTSGFAEADVLAKKSKNGFLFLQKPCPPLLLLAKIRDYLDAAPRRGKA